MSASTTPIPPDLSLALRLQGFRRRYGVALRFAQGGKETKVHYEADLFCPFAASDGTFQLSLHKHQVFINDRAPESVMEILADRCGKVLYPIVLKGGPNAILKGLLNGDAIRTRWADAVPGFYDYYTGDVAMNILSAMERAVSSDTFVFDAVRQDWLLTLLFAPIFQRYASRQATAELFLPLIPYKAPVRFSVTLSLEPQPTESGLTVINCCGTCTDPRSAHDILKGHPVPVAQSGSPAAGELEFRFKVYPTNSTIFSVEGACRLTLPDGSEKKVAMELFQLGRPDAIPTSQQGASLIMDESPPVAKSGWRSLFG